MDRQENKNNNLEVDKSQILEKKISNKKVVLLHDWLTGFRGGERVFEVLCEIFPQAPIYTLFYNPGTTSPIIEKHPIKSSVLNRLPGVHKYYRKLLPLYPWAAERLVLPTDTDMVISSSHCVIKGITFPAGKKIPHLSYIHSPMRYVYDQFDNYFGPSSGASFLQKVVAKAIRKPLQRWDYKSNKQVDILIANSEFVRQRIKNYYHREADVIYPFVDLKDFQEVQKAPPQKEDFFLIVSAFAPNKRVDLAIEAFKNWKSDSNQPYHLKIVGKGQLENSLRAQAETGTTSGSIIEFLGESSREEIVSLLARAQALIFPGVEDFGIVPLEALAAGTPVIAYQAGGVLETLNFEVAVFFKDATADSLLLALKRFMELKHDRRFGRFNKPEVMYAQAQKFSKERFKFQIVEKVLALLKMTNS